MPALGKHAGDTHTRSLHLIGLGLVLVFLATVGAVWSDAVEAKDWTPQIMSTRRAQIYWESLMRAADAELRSLKKSGRQAQRKLTTIESNFDRAVRKRVAAKSRLEDARAELATLRERQEVEAIVPAMAVTTVAPPEPAEAPQAFIEPIGVLGPVAPAPVPSAPAAPPVAVEPDALPATSAQVVGPETAGLMDERTLAKLERQVKQAKRELRQSQRKAGRSARNTRSAKARVRAIRSSRSGAFARRASAERSLGAWVLAMTKYGRIRATKKSDARPGVNSSFAWPVQGRISQYFHATHDGIDIVRYTGAPVRSMAFGVVTYVGWNPWDQHGRAFMVVVTHAGGYETLYGHLLPRRVVRVGQEVRKGEVVGYMGSTGNSTGPHLHLELRRGRTTINPLGFL